MGTFIRRLEVQGFKSFAQKTVFDFPTRVTGIVGPNGSGKSNIVDGLRWVLGERAAKNLRGDSLENLIFAGTPKKPASSFARVSLVFDNSKRLFSVEAEEVAVERKVDKSGISQFFINSSEVKLKDLLLTLARTKLGTRGLTIIGQGQSDLFVKSTPKERRFMIEEILGLKEFRIKKEEAERHLENSEINLEKVGAMIEEIEPHIKFLRKQKNRWDKKSEIEKDLREFENKFFGLQGQKLVSELKKTEEPIELFLKKGGEKNSQIKLLESELITPKEEIADSNLLSKIKREIEGLITSRTAIEKDIVRFETKLELQSTSKNAPAVSPQELITYAKNLYAELKSIITLTDTETIHARLKPWLYTLEKIIHKEKEAPIENVFEKISPLKHELKIVDEKIKSLKNEEEEIIEKQQKHNQEFRSQVEKIERVKNELRILENKIQEIRIERERAKIKLEELERQWLNAGRTSEEWTEILKNNHGFIQPEMNDIERKIMRLRSEISAIGEIDNELVKEAEETEKRFEFLTKEKGDLESAIINLKKLISELNSRIDREFRNFFKKINDAFDSYFSLMFGGGKARLKIVEQEIFTEENEGGEESLKEENPESKTTGINGVEIEINIPRKKIKSLDMLSGGERSLVSLAALFALISISNPPFLVLDEIDAALDEENARRFSDLVKNFSQNTQFIIVTHNRITMEITDVLFGITMGDDGVSKVLSLKLENH